MLFDRSPYKQEIPLPAPPVVLLKLFVEDIDVLIEFGNDSGLLDLWVPLGTVAKEVEDLGAAMDQHREFAGQGVRGVDQDAAGRDCLQDPERFVGL